MNLRNGLLCLAMVAGIVTAGIGLGLALILGVFLFGPAIEDAVKQSREPRIIIIRGR